MFIGTYYHTIEDKGRVSLPKKFREIGTDWVITRGLDGGLFLFLNNTFTAELEKLNQYAFTKKAHRDMIRLMTNEAQEVQVDPSGRILIPEYLRATAQLAKEVAIIGSYQRIEIWDVEKYHQYIDQLETQAEAIAEKVGDNA
jgi:MraZ protein